MDFYFLFFWNSSYFPLGHITTTIVPYHLSHMYKITIKPWVQLYACEVGIAISKLKIVHNIVTDSIYIL